MLRKILAIWLAVSIVLYAVFGLSFSGKEYLARFQNFPDFLDVFQGVINAFKQIVDSFKTLGTTGDFLKVIANIMVGLFKLIQLPFEIIGYVIDVIMIVLPVGIGA